MNDIVTDHIICGGCARPFTQAEWREHLAAYDAPNAPQHFTTRDAAGDLVLAFFGAAMVVRMRPDA
jgi:hypothetical protein